MNIFNYESKFMQFLLLVADYIILNFVFVLCCIPIFTIGAAQAGLYSGVRVLLDKEDDSSCVKAFFKGFRTGFGTITVTFNIITVLMVAVVYIMYVTLAFQQVNYAAPVWMCFVALAILIVYQSNLTPFHAKFGCTKRQLMKNVFFTVLSHPIRSLGVAAITWFPVAVLLLAFPLFIQATLFWVCGCYTIMFVANTAILAKPYKRITEKFVQAYEEANGEVILEEQPDNE